MEARLEPSSNAGATPPLPLLPSQCSYHTSTQHRNLSTCSRFSCRCMRRRRRDMGARAGFQRLSYCADCEIIKGRAQTRGFSVAQLQDAFEASGVPALFGDLYPFMVGGTRFDTATGGGATPGFPAAAPAQGDSSAAPSGAIALTHAPGPPRAACFAQPPALRFTWVLHSAASQHAAILYHGHDLIASIV